MTGMSSSSRLVQAVQVARDGRRQEALALFYRLVIQEPENEIAWIWISDLTDDAHERITALEKALAIRPGSPGIKHRLDRLRLQQEELDQPGLPQISNSPGSSHGAEQVSFDNQFNNYSPIFTVNPFSGSSVGPDGPDEREVIRQAYHRARQLVRAGQRKQALDELLNVIKTDPVQTESEPGYAPIWLMIADLHTDLSAKITAMEKALELRPNAPELRENLHKLRQINADPWQRARQLEEIGEFPQAEAVYWSIATHSRSPVERLEASRQAANLKLRQEAVRITPVNPTVNVLRLAVGPVLLFALIIFIQSGLNILRIETSSLISLAGVFTGSLLLAAIEQRPLHPTWIKIFGHPGSRSEADARVILQVLGWLLVVLPFILFLLGASVRLVELWREIVTWQP